MQPYDLCNNEAICSVGSTGQISLMPLLDAQIDMNCYTFDLMQNGITINDMPTYHDDRSISFSCLSAGSYTIRANNEIINCGYDYPAILNPVSTSPNGSMIYTSIATSAGNCTGEASITHIASEYMATAYHYNFSWSDCNPPESCNTFSRTELCAGNYNITATNQLTGCSSFHSININDGTIADNEFLSVSF